MAKKASRTPEPKKNPVMEFFRNLSWGWVLLWAGGVTTLLGAVVMWDKAHPIIEPHIPFTTPGYVRQYANETADKKFTPVEKWMGTTDHFRIEQTLEIAKLNLTNLNENLRKAKDDLKKNPSILTLQDTVVTLEKQVADVKVRIQRYQDILNKKEEKQ